MNVIQQMRQKMGNSSFSQSSALNESISPMAFASLLDESVTQGLHDDYTILTESTHALLNENASPLALTESIIGSLVETIKKIWTKIVDGAKGVAAWIREQVDKMRMSGQQLASKSEYANKVKAKNYKDFEYEGYDFIDVKSSTWPVADIQTFIVKEGFTDEIAITVSGDDTDKAIADFKKNKTEKITDSAAEVTVLKTKYFGEVTGIKSGGTKMESSKMIEEMFKALRGGKSEKKAKKGLDADALISRLKNPEDLEAVKDGYDKLVTLVSKLRDEFETTAKSIESEKDEADAKSVKIASAKAEYIRKLSSLYESVLSVANTITNAKVAAVKDRVSQDTMLFKKALAFKEAKKDNNSYIMEDSDDDFLGEIDAATEA